MTYLDIFFGGTSLSWKGYDPGGHLKKCRSPGQEKCRKKCFGKCRSETGCRGKCLRVPSPILHLHRRGAQSTFVGTFLGTPFRTGTFRSTFIGTFPGRGFGTSLDGRQDRNGRGIICCCRCANIRGGLWGWLFFCLSSGGIKSEKST